MDNTELSSFIENNKTVIEKLLSSKVSLSQIENKMIKDEWHDRLSNSSKGRYEHIADLANKYGKSVSTIKNIVYGK